MFSTNVKMNNHKIKTSFDSPGMAKGHLRWKEEIDQLPPIEFEIKKEKRNGMEWWHFLLGGWGYLPPK